MINFRKNYYHNITSNMKHIIFIISLIIANVAFAQKTDIEILSVKTARIIDRSFFEQLDSIMKHDYKKKFRFYNLHFCDENLVSDMETDFKPLITDSIYHIGLIGSSKAYYINSYLVTYNNNKYFIPHTANNIFVKKNGDKTIVTPKNSPVSDFHSQFLILEYKRKKLTVISDSNKQKYYDDNGD